MDESKNAINIVIQNKSEEIISAISKSYHKHKKASHRACFFYFHDEKSDGVFDLNNDLINQDQLENYYALEVESKAQGCPKYVGVISFTNEFLEESGVISPRGVDINRLKAVARSGMSEMIHTSNKLDDDNVYWTAAIHINTDNVHIHFVVLEKEKRHREKDMLEVKAFDKLKSKVANKLIGDERTIRITEIARQSLLPDMKREFYNGHTAIVQLAHVLPPDQTLTTNEYTAKPLSGRFATIERNIFFSLRDNSAFMLFCGIAMHCNQDNMAFPSLTQMSDRTGLSRTTIISKISYLLEHGYLHKERYTTLVGDYGHNNHTAFKLAFRAFFMWYLYKSDRIEQLIEAIKHTVKYIGFDSSLLSATQTRKEFINSLRLLCEFERSNILEQSRTGFAESRFMPERISLK